MAAPARTATASTAATADVDAEDVFPVTPIAPTRTTATPAAPASSLTDIASDLAVAAAIMDRSDAELLAKVRFVCARRRARVRASNVCLRAQCTWLKLSFRVDTMVRRVLVPVAY
jgi:hypothetical protein